MSTTTYRPWTATYPCDVSSADPDLQTIADDAARSLLWALTGRRLGVAVTVGERFRVTACESDGGRGWTPYIDNDGDWRNAVCGGACCTLMLRNAPLRTVTEIRVDGSVVTDWSYDAGHVLLHDGCPVCDDCTDGAAIEVDYTWGVDVDAHGQAAYGELSCEFLKGLSGDPCRLSARAISVTRQGVTTDLFDATDIVELGLTGLPITDAFIRTLNPNRLRQRSRVLSPDLPRSAG